MLRRVASLGALSVAVHGGWAQTTPATPNAGLLFHRHGMFGSSHVAKIRQARDGGRALPDDPLKGFKAQVALPPQNVPYANFVGNATVIAADAANGFMMARETDCSLTAFNVPFSYQVSNPYTTYTSKTTDYGPVLHSEAGLTTTGNNFNGNCKDPSIGIAANDLLYAGMSKNGIRMSAVAAYDGTLGYNVLYTFAMQENGALINSTVQTLPATNQPYSVIAGDLNGDGNPDLVAVGWVNTSGTSTSAITILTGNDDGTFTVGQTYPLGSGVTDTAVLDDFNGDGKLDIVVPAGGGTVQFSNATGTLIFLPGNGDGTFGTQKTMPAVAESLVSGDFNHDGHKDLASGTGAIFLGNGDGTFQQTSTPLFTKLETNSNASPQLAVGDFNKDGKLDIAAGTGVSIYVYLGNGDGTFNPGNIYAGINNHGYLAATDLDGDGNLDLYSGNAQNGVFSGDDFSANLGQALMGRGDGTFVGAPQTGDVQFNTLQDVNGDGKLDFVGLTSQLVSGQYVESLGTYLGNGDGTFHQAGAPLNPAVYSYQGTQYTPGGVSSYTVADINGDGHPDIIYLPSFPYLNLNPPRQGFLVALGNADGSYQAPIFVPAPTLSPGSPDNSNEEIVALGDLAGAVNQDGKFEIVYSFQTAVFVTSNSSLAYFAGYATQVSNGDGTFAAPAVTITYTGPTAPTSMLPPALVTLTDLNLDKVPDMITYTPVVYTNGVLTTPPTYQVMLGKSDGTFGAAANLPVISSPQSAGTQSGGSLYPLSIGDVNGDGIPDVVAEGEVPVTGSTTDFNYALGVALGKGDGTFTVKPPILVANTIGVAQVAVGDFTGDGKADIGFLSFAQGSNGIFAGNGDGTFQSLPSGYNDGTVVPSLTIELTSGQGNAGAFDLNGDGKISLVAGNTFFVPAAAASTQLTPSTTALSASASSVVVGASVTLTATVTATTGSGTPTGTVTFLDGTTSLGTGTLNSSGVATLSTTTLAVGSHSITAQYGGDSSFSASASSAVTITVTSAAATPAASTTTLAASATTATTGDNITFTATVAGPSGNTTVPTGTVTFLNGTTSLGTGTLNSTGVATLSTTALPAGADSITAQYGGDANFNASTSTAVTVTVSAPAVPSFSISLSPTSATVTNGSSTTTMVSIQPAGGFSAAVSFACSGLPNGATCSFSPATVTPAGGAAATTTLTIATGSASASLARPGKPDTRGWPDGRPVVAWGLVLLGMSGLVGRRRRAGRWLRGMQMLGVLAVLMGMASCGSSHHSTTSTVTVTASSGNLSQSATFSLTTK